ncbi:MAG: SurA N-terminal domain-containing protein [Sulfurifustis sp.]
MLAKIREKTQGIIATLILTFVAIPFILWGISSYFDRGSSVAVAKVNGVEISQQAYRQRLEELRGIDPRRADNRALHEMILESMIEQSLLTRDAEDHGYRMSDARLAQMIHDLPYFRRDGRFDSTMYEALLRRQGLRPSDFEAQLRRENLTTQVQRGLGETAFVTDEDVTALIRLIKQERRVSYAIVSPEAFLPKVSVSDAEINEYYQANQESFRSPEAVRVEYVTLRASDASQQVQPTEDELRQAYNADAARYVTPEKRRASHILISVPSGANADADKTARARAEALAKELRGGANFAAVAKKQSDDKDSAARGGDLGDLVAGTLPPELDAAVRALKPGEVSAPVHTQYGYHIVKLTSYQPEQRKSFESVRAQLLDQLRKRKGEERFYELAERFRNLVYEHSEGLQPAAKELGLTVQTSDWFTKSGGSGIAAQPRVVTAAFEPDVVSRARNSDAIEINPETLVALHVVEYRPSAVRPLTEVRATIERTLKERRAAEQARARAQEWLKQLEQGTKLADIARSGGAKVETGKALTRENSGGVDKRLADAVFAAARPKDRPVAGEVDLGQQGSAVYVLEAVRDIDPATADAELKQRIKRQLVQRRGADYYMNYRSGLRKTADVKINTDQL